MICKNLRVFVKTFLTDEKYSPLIRDNLTEPIQMHFSQEVKTFSEFFSAVFKSRLKFEHFLKRMTLIVGVFPKVRTPKYAVK